MKAQNDRSNVYNISRKSNLKFGFKKRACAQAQYIHKLVGYAHARTHVNLQNMQHMDQVYSSV